MPKRNNPKKNQEDERMDLKKNSSFAKNKGEKMNKEAGKNKRENFRKEFIKNKKKKREKPQKNKHLEMPPKVSFDQVEVSEKSERHEKQQERHENKSERHEDKSLSHEGSQRNEPVETVDDSKLPTSEYEEQREDEREDEKEEEKKEENQEPLQREGVDEDVVPINPFEATASPSSTIEVKALDKKPLDRKSGDVVKETRKEPKSAPEDLEHSDEELDKSDEQMGEEGAAQEAVAAHGAEAAEKSHEPPVVAEVVGQKAPEKTADEYAKKLEEELNDADEDDEDLWEILAQAGITKKKIVVVFLLMVFVIMFFWFGGLSLFGVGGGGGEKDVAVDKVLPSGTRGGTVAGIVSSYVFGLEFEAPKTPLQAVPIGRNGTLAGVDSAFYFGKAKGKFENRFVYYVDLVRRMDNLYNTDVYELIDLAVDRRSALEKHITQLDSVIKEADNVAHEIQARLDDFDKEFGDLALERDNYEERFFTSVDDLTPRSANDNLESFIAIQHDANELKAYYNAYKTVLDYIFAYLDLLEPRYQDVVSNKEALIKGIRVFDVPNSDIKAILPLDNKLQ